MTHAAAIHVGMDGAELSSTITHRKIHLVASAIRDIMEEFVINPVSNTFLGISLQNTWYDVV